jgi:hypothetical protein
LRPYVHPKVTPTPASAPVYDEPDYSVLSDAELEPTGETVFEGRSSHGHSCRDFAPQKPAFSASSLASCIADPSRSKAAARGALCVSNAVAPTYDKFTGIYDISARTIHLLRLTPIDNNVFGRAGLLAHTFMLGPNGDSKGCVSFRNYDAFLQAYLRGEVKRLAVVARLN